MEDAALTSSMLSRLRSCDPRTWWCTDSHGRCVRNFIVVPGTIVA